MGGTGGNMTVEEKRAAGGNGPITALPVAVGKLLRYTMTHDYVAGDFMWTGIDYLGEGTLALPVGQRGSAGYLWV